MKRSLDVSEQERNDRGPDRDEDPASKVQRLEDPSYSSSSESSNHQLPPTSSSNQSIAGESTDVEEEEISSGSHHDHRQAHTSQEESEEEQLSNIGMDINDAEINEVVEELSLAGAIQRENVGNHHDEHDNIMQHHGLHHPLSSSENSSSSSSVPPSSSSESQNSSRSTSIHARQITPESRSTTSSKSPVSPSNGSSNSSANSTTVPTPSGNSSVPSPLPPLSMIIPGNLGIGGVESIGVGIMTPLPTGESQQNNGNGPVHEHHPIPIPSHSNDISLSNSLQNGEGKAESWMSRYEELKGMKREKEKNPSLSSPQQQRRNLQENSPSNANTPEENNEKLNLPNGSTVEGFGPVMNKWISNQRAAYHKNKLSEEKVKLLEEIGVSLKGKAQVEEERWYQKLEELKEYKRVHGHCTVKQSEGSLGRWVNIQRLNAKTQRMDPNRIKMLEEVGFEWNGRDRYDKERDDHWPNMYEQLKHYKNLHGDCNVRYKGTGDLGKWVHTQRYLRNQNKLAQDKIRLLNDLHFAWKIRATKSKQNSVGSISPSASSNSSSSPSNSASASNSSHPNNLNLSVQDVENSSNVPSTASVNSSEGGNHGTHSGNSLPPLDVGTALEAVEMDFSMTSPHRKSGSEHSVTVPYHDPGSGSIPHVTDISIANLTHPPLPVNQQQVHHPNENSTTPAPSEVIGSSSSNVLSPSSSNGSGSTLNPSNSPLISGGGGDPSSRTNYLPYSIPLRWQKKYEELKEYRRVHGHCNVKQSEGPLGNWILHQRTNRSKQKLGELQIRLLEEIGFNWFGQEEVEKERDSQWMRSYEELIGYKSTHGDCNVSRAFGPLGKWVINQRYRRKGNHLSDRRIKLLDEIGFIWQTRPARYPIVRGLSGTGNSAEAHDSEGLSTPSKNSTAGGHVRSTPRRLPQHRGGKKGDSRQRSEEEEEILDSEDHRHVPVEEEEEEGVEEEEERAVGEELVRYEVEDVQSVVMHPNASIHHFLDSHPHLDIVSSSLLKNHHHEDLEHHHHHDHHDLLLHDQEDNNPQVHHQQQHHHHGQQQPEEHDHSFK
eukprot:TRINITY_DN5772_c0_g1_i2.p1 TRINITY_DN5772_c0_g1~~TRINITY_DN5772_c0_g1_i2.p1  ORF type:complete len:1052 (-),score=297.29 TRINITY_DN5772_c0_g1_i2:10-3165(-)